VRRELRIEDVVGVVSLGVRARAVTHRQQVFTVADDAFADQEAGEQVHVVAGGAHRHSECLARDPQLERFLDDEGVRRARRRLPDSYARDLLAYRHPAHSPSVPQSLPGQARRWAPGA
jgi:hypothetical protein